MQQLAGPLGLLNPLILQQVAAYGNYSQVVFLFFLLIVFIRIKFYYLFYLKMFQQQALMNAAAQGAYISPVALSNGQLSQVNGLSNGSVTPTTGNN
jgi:hypothetical protein